ncbi:MAG: ADP-ribosylglycohydrolase family protein [candidate division KSB1 bacterium]|nr:ADP-ribosylglycohydrolase family protein [candidate division KSB1 bacterium]
MKKMIWLIPAVILLLNCGTKKIQIPVEDVENKIYASWLGQIVGNIYGLPHENAYIQDPGPEEFPYGYRDNLDRLEQINGAFSDDDTDFEYMYLLAMEKYGPDPKYSELTQSWLYHVRDRVWLANRAALGAMHYGYTPPVTGMRRYNPHWFQIDPQLVNEIWAVTAPGMIDYATAKSDWAARITNDGWGVEPTIHYGAMYAAAFFESDINTLIDIGVQALPANSRFAQTVQDMKTLHQKYPDDWQAARQEMAETYYHNEPLDTKTIWNANLNGACGILALLYGEGNFQKTLDLSCAIGFDADNQAATLSGLLAIIVGIDGIPRDLLYPIEEWQEPFNDFYKNVSRHDLPDVGLRATAQRMALQAEKIILAHGGKKVKKNGQWFYQINQTADFSVPMELPNAPMPFIEVGQDVNYTVFVTGGQGSIDWKIIEGQLPEGIVLNNGFVTGKTAQPGIFNITIQADDGKTSATRTLTLCVVNRNLAGSATRVLSNVRHTNVLTRDAMWLSVPYSLYTDSVDAVRDGVRYGDGSTFYSIDGSHQPKTDFYGYEWRDEQTVGVLNFCTGAMEESGGWFSTLDVQYLNQNSKWTSVENLVIYPELVGRPGPYNKPHFVNYILAFEPVQTTAVRMIGEAGHAPHWHDEPSYFTSIAELSVHRELSGYETLK